jgi:hypothetical protein
MSDKCERCGSVGSDRRTLWMACLYQMNELGLPFKELSMNGTLHEVESREPVIIGGMNLGDRPKWGPPVGGNEPARRHFYTMLVCKRCRAEWMQAIADWFRNAPPDPDNDADSPAPSRIGSGIFVRRNGTNVEVSEEEWYRENPGRDPVRVKPVT